MKIAPGTRLGAYRVQRKLGEGGMGAVFEGVHEHLQKRVAIKTLHEQFARDASAVARFAREGRAASRIRHPHVIDITDVGMQDGSPYLVMEMLEGESLAGLLHRAGPQPIQTIADVMLPVLDALSAAHAAGIVHRDLKPENVFLATSRGPDIHPIVLDFGISCIEDEVRLTKTAHFMGTPYYMSPEQAQSARSVDARSDQFSLGLVLFELVTGRRALSGSSVLEVVHRVSTEGAIRLSVVRPDLPPAFTAIVDRMTERNPAARFGSMREVGAALLAFASPRAVAVWSNTFLGAATSRSAPPPASAYSTPPPSFPSSVGTHDGPSSSVGPVHVSVVTPGQPQRSFSTPGQPQPSFSAPPSTRSSHASPPQASFTPSQSRSSSSQSRSPSSAPPGLATDPTVNARASALPGASAQRALESAPPAKPRSPVLLAVIALTGVLAAVGIAFIVGITFARQGTESSPTPTAPPTAAPPVAPETEPSAPTTPTTPLSATIDIRLRAVPATAEIALDGAVVANGSYAQSLARDGIPHVLEVRAPGFIPHRIEFLDVAPVAEIVLEEIPRHHHGPVVPRRSSMTAQGLVEAPPESAHAGTGVIEPLPTAHLPGAGSGGSGPAPVAPETTPPEATPPPPEPAAPEATPPPDPPPAAPPEPDDGWAHGATPDDIIPFE